MSQGFTTDFFKPDIPDNAVYHVGISGGKDSGAVLLWMVHESGIPRDRIRASFCDTGHEHDWTYEQVSLLSEKVHPIVTLKPEHDFFALAQKKQRFPSPRARFCTEHLKIRPTQDHIDALRKESRCVISVSGVRASESEERSQHLEWDYSGHLLTLQWRPILRWDIDDVVAIHKRHGIPLNRLYAEGAERVGCWPCVLCKKGEIRRVATHFPERIATLRGWEAAISSSFFPPSRTPRRFHSGSCVNRNGETITFPLIDDVVRWSMTGKRAKGSYLDDEPEPISCSSGFCE